MADRSRQREKILERELVKLAGSNWQVRVLTTPYSHWLTELTLPLPFFCIPLCVLAQANLEIAPAGISSPLPTRTATALFSPSMRHTASPTPVDGNLSSKAGAEATTSHVEQVRLLILGMEERLRTREEKLVKTIEKADQESHRFEVLRNEALPAKT